MSRSATRIAALVSIVLIYCGSYLHYRHSGEIIHRKTWAERNFHAVQAVHPDERIILMGTLLESPRGTNAFDRVRYDQIVEDAAISAERRRLVLSIGFAPLRWAETAVWYVVDYRDNDVVQTERQE